MLSKGVGRVTRSSLRVASIERPGWRSEPGHIPNIGDQVLCVEGLARVVTVLGRTSDGSRLLELTLPDRKQPFFAASSNVMTRIELGGE